MNYSDWLLDIFLGLGCAYFAFEIIIDIKYLGSDE